MTYFKIDGVDFSNYVNALKVSTNNNYNAQINAAGNTVVDFVNKKKEVEVGIIPLDDTAMAKLQSAISKFNVSISYLNPKTKRLETINCVIPKDAVDYYTIQVGKVMYNSAELTFIEL